ELDNLGQRNTGPFSNTRPALNTVVFGNLCLPGQLTQVTEREPCGIEYLTSHFKLPVGKVILRQASILLCVSVLSCWWSPVNPEVRRDVGRAVVLPRCNIVQQSQTYWVYNRAQCVLHAPSMPQGVPRGPYVDS